MCLCIKYTDTGIFLCLVFLHIFLQTAALYNYGAVNRLLEPWNTYTRTENRNENVGSSAEAAFAIVVCTGSGDSKSTDDDISVIKFGDGDDMNYDIR